MPHLIQLLAFPIWPRISDPRISPATWNITFTAIQNNELVVHEPPLCGCCWLDRVRKWAKYPTRRSRADLQTLLQDPCQYSISRTSGGWKLKLRGVDSLNLTIKLPRNGRSLEYLGLHPLLGVAEMCYRLERAVATRAGSARRRPPLP